MKKTVLIIAFIWTTPLSIFSQKDSLSSVKKDKITPQIVNVVTKDGSSFLGELLERRSDSVIIKTETIGQIGIATTQIKSISNFEKSDTKHGASQNWFRNRYAVQGFLLSTGFGLKKGEGYYENTMIFLNRVYYGIHDNFSIGGGTILFNILDIADNPIFYIDPKVSFQLTKGVNMSIGTYVGVGANGNFFPYSNLTLGSRDNYFNVGGYYSVEEKEFLWSFGGQVRTGKRFALNLESYTNASFSSPISIIGAKYMTENFSFNFGLFFTFGQGNGFSFPYIGVTLPFGNKKLKP